VRKAIAAAGAVVAATALALTGCSSGGSNQSESGGDVTIQWSNDASGSVDAALWQHLADLVHEKYPEITVELTNASWNDYWTKMPTQLASNNAPCIVTMQMGYMPQFKSSLKPLDEGMLADAGIKTADFAPVSLTALQSDGTQYAVPWDFGPYLLYYNKDMFKAAGVPEPTDDWTASDFVDAGKKLSTGGKYGFMINDSIDAVQQWGPTLAGVQAVTKDNKLDVDNDKVESVVSWYADLVKQGIAAPIAASNQQSTTGSAYMSGTAAMYVDGPWSMYNVKSTAKFDAGVVMLPTGDGGPATTSGGSGFSITNKCSNPDAALKAIAVMTDDEAQASLGTAGRAFPARTSQQDTWYKGAVAGSQETMEKALATAVPYRSTASWTQDALAWTQGVVSVLNGQSEPGPFLKSVQSQSPSAK
jgi:multiple sugar transport system substrate-binding protein